MVKKEAEHHAGFFSPLVDHKRIKIVASCIPPQSRVLDLGCGAGGLIPVLPSGCSYVGVDHTPGLIESNKENFPQHFFRQIDMGECILPFNSGAFDVVILAAFLGSLKNPRILLSEVARVLKSRGLVVVTTPSTAGGRLHGILAALRMLANDASTGVVWNKAKLEECLPLTGLSLADFKMFEMGLNQLFILKKEPHDQ